MPARLSQNQVSQYQREGYTLFHEPVLKPHRFAALRNHFEELLKQWTAVEGRRPEAMDLPHMTDQGLFEWLFDDDLLDVIESLIGPNIALWSSHFICKPAGTGQRVPWHEDSTYWRTALDPMEVVTLWLAIDQSTPENGCMRVIPASHHNGYSQYEAVADPKRAVFNTEVKAGEFDEATAVDCVLEPNACSLHHAKLIHGSNANTSPLRRCGYTMRYISTASKFTPKLSREGKEIYLARGRDLAGNTYGDPTRISPYWRNQLEKAATG
jgi:hypothetical protein